MPSREDIEQFISAEHKWNDDAPAKTIGGIGNSGHTWGTHDAAEWDRKNKFADALNSTFYIQGVPTSADDYESRVANMIAVAESRGWTAVRVKRDAHHNPTTGFAVPYSEQFLVEDQNVNIHASTIRADRDFTGLMHAESWFRAQYAEQAKEINARQLKEAKALREHEARKEEALNQPVYGWQLEEVREELAAIRKLLEKQAGE